MKIFRPLWPLLVALTMLGGCAVNPVTGEKELTLVSQSDEIEIGREQYLPTRQTEGGDYTLDPALTRYVQGVGQRIAKVSDRDLPYEFVVLNNSTPNAWALPGGKIAVNRGLLLELNSEAELAAVLGHEAVHAAARHGAKSMERGLMLQGAVAAVGIAVNDENYAQLALGAASVGANLISQTYSRSAELESDHYGILYMHKAGYDPSAAVDLQETFVRLSEGREENWLAGLFSSHPPSMERVEANRETIRRQGLTGGEMGTDRYQRMIAGLQRTKPAYDAYDEGREALTKGDTASALRLAEKAIRIEPREALFQGLKGDALAERGDLRAAEKAYDNAVARDDSFFAYFLNRGMVREQLGDRGGAGRDLQRSLQLLPTANANFLLGEMALASGNTQNALGYYQAATDSNSGAGRQSRVRVAQLELPSHPEKYLQSALQLNRDGRVWVIVQNRSDIAVTNVQVQVGQRGATGVRGGERYTLQQVLAPGEKSAIPTRLGGITNGEQLNAWASQVVHAEAAR